MNKLSKIVYLYLILIFLILAGGAFALGKMMAMTKNIKQSELFVDFNPALPSRILDIRGDLITEFSLDEKRELINYGDISPNLIAALLAREDRLFYEHKGFRIKSIIRAIIGQLTRRSLGGGSTITQQIAGILYCDRTDKSGCRPLATSVVSARSAIKPVTRCEPNRTRTRAPGTASSLSSAGTW